MVAENIIHLREIFTGITIFLENLQRDCFFAKISLVDGFCTISRPVNDYSLFHNYWFGLFPYILWKTQPIHPYILGIKSCGCPSSPSPTPSTKIALKCTIQLPSFKRCRLATLGLLYNLPKQKFLARHLMNGLHYQRK